MFTLSLLPFSQGRKFPFERKVLSDKCGPNLQSATDIRDYVRGRHYVRDKRHPYKCLRQRQGEEFAHISAYVRDKGEEFAHKVLTSETS
jgi:hypothetical protein